MIYRKPTSTTIFLTISLFVLSSLAYAQYSDSCKLEGFKRTKQITNYCGPACLTSVLRYYGMDITQQQIGKDIYDPVTGATNGADMLVYARKQGYSAYSWNSNLVDVKKKIETGAPVIVLTQNSRIDTSGHYRVLTGYNDETQKFQVMDPYYDEITELSYTDCERLWKTMGHWALIIMPVAKDKFAVELGEKNPVVHMDLSYAKYKSKQYDDALLEAQTALKLEPGNTFARSMLDKIQYAMGAGAK